MGKVLEIYTVDRAATPCPNAERVRYIKRQHLSDATGERFFDSVLDEVLVNLCAARVLTVLEKHSEAAVAKQQVEDLLRRLTV